jgi:hypothetical protein
MELLRQRRELVEVTEGAVVELARLFGADVSKSERGKRGAKLTASSLWKFVSELQNRINNENLHICKRNVQYRARIRAVRSPT